MTLILGIRSLLSPGLPESPDLVLREILDDPQQRRVVLVAPALPLHLEEHLVDDRGHGQDHPVLPARRERYPEVLVVQLGAEARIEGVGEELLALDLHDLVAGEPAREDVEDLLGADCTLGTQNEGLAYRLDGEGDYDLVGLLCSLARTRWTDVVHGLANGLEQRSRSLEVLLAPANHDGERALD